MTDAEALDFIKGPIRLVRTGSFTAVFQDVATMETLKSLAQRKDAFGAQSAAILAETYDQVGEFKEARSFANLDVGERQLEALRDEIRLHQPKPHVVRAHAWLLLQCAVSEFRTQGGYGHGLELFSKGIDLISTNSGEAIVSQHIQSLFYFWRGRILSTAFYNFRDADRDFEKALSVADKTLDEKLKEAGDPKKRGERNRDTELAAGAYVLATVLSFGLGQSRQFESRLRDSLWFLRAAVPLSRGSADFHRRGFAHLLMGTALRGIGQLQDAEEHLRIAKKLLEEPVCHLLHLARVHHQLALCRYNHVPPGVARSKEHKTLLKEALKDNRRASELSGHDSYKEFKDPLLEYGIKVAQSLILTALGKFKEAYRLADEAIRTTGYNVPRGTHGWALVAKGMALAERVERRDQTDDIRKAESALQEVVENRNLTELRHSDRASAHLHLSRLYSRIGQPFKAAIHYERAKPLVKRSEHGWLRDLQESAGISLKVDVGPELRVNIEDLLKAAGNSKDGPWRYINRHLELDLKRRLLSRIQHQEILKQQDGENKLATALGLTRATLFAWKRDAELKDFFPSKSTKGNHS